MVAYILHNHCCNDPLRVGTFVLNIQSANDTFKVDMSNEPPWRKTFFADKESLVAGRVLHNWCLQTMCTSPFPVGCQVGTGVCNESKEDGQWRFCAPWTMGTTCKMAIVGIFLTNESCKRFWYPFHRNLAFFAILCPTIAIIVLDSCQESLSDALLTTDLNQITTANVIYQTEFIIDLIQSKNTPRCWKLRSNLLLCPSLRKFYHVLPLSGSDRQPRRWIAHTIGLTGAGEPRFLTVSHLRAVWDVAKNR